MLEERGEMLSLYSQASQVQGLESWRRSITICTFWHDAKILLLVRQKPQRRCRFGAVNFFCVGVQAG